MTQLSPREPATGGSGWVSLESADSLSRRYEAGDGDVQVSVTDTGAGIPPGDLPRIFEPHFRGSGKSGATGRAGLGLAISRRIVELHGGTIWAESRGERHGSTFSFILPVNGVDAEHETESLPQQEDSNAGMEAS